MHNIATPSLVVVKLGGNAMGADGARAVLEDVRGLVAGGRRVVLVHGGGPDIDAALAREGVETQRVAGLRVTSEPALRITEAALCGTVNKRLVRLCRMLGVSAAGISGQDGGLLVAEPSKTRDGISLGAVGDIVAVDCRLIHALLAGGFVPVIAPLAVAAGGTQAFNVNADTAAGAIAAALHADAYINVSNVSSVVAGDGAPVARMHADEAERFLNDPACGSGMVPKLQSAIDAVRAGVLCAVICGAGAGALRAALAGAGTTIYFGRTGWYSAVS